MSDDNDLKAFLHIVHVSDIHCKIATPRGQVVLDGWVRALVQRLRKGPPRFVEWASSIEKDWAQGLAGHDIRAHQEMRNFLRWFASSSQFGGIDTWLVGTGDLSALGDMGSLTTAIAWLNDYKTILNAKEFLIFPGNHDAWPGKFPFFANNSEINLHQVNLGSLFQAPWPQTGVSIPIPYSNSKLCLYAVNSVIGDRWWNTLARGWVGAAPPGPTAGSDQLASLGKWVNQNFHTDPNVRDFRILAIHHPIHYPPPRPGMTMSLLNDKQVAKALIRFDRINKRGKLAHLVLSGHTHEVYPAVGSLPAWSTGQGYFPLADGQMQLITGSLTQAISRQDRKKCRPHEYIPQQFQILTFFSSPKPTRRNQLLIERRLVGRRNARGPFKVLQPPNRSKIESVLMEY